MGRGLINHTDRRCSRPKHRKHICGLTDKSRSFCHFLFRLITLVLQWRMSNLTGKIPPPCRTPRRHRLLRFHLRWSPGGSDGEVEAGPPGCGSTYWRVQEVLPHIPLYAGCVALASIPTTHLLQDRVLGVAVLVRLGALISARALPSSLLMFRPSCTPVLCSR